MNSSAYPKLFKLVLPDQYSLHLSKEHCTVRALMHKNLRTPSQIHIVFNGIKKKKLKNIKSR